MKQFAILSFTLLTLFSNAQDSIKRRTLSVLPVPAIGYSPETKTYLGAVVLFTLRHNTDTLRRSSNAKIEFNYTWNKQIITEIGWNHFTREEKWFTDGILHFSKYPDWYYGIGPNTQDSMVNYFESIRYRANTSLLRNLGNDVFVGAGLRHINYNELQIEASDHIHDELAKANNTGIQLIASWDKRNNILTPTKGYLLKLINEYNYSESIYSKITLDARKYYSKSGKIDQVVSLRLFTDHIFGNAPFYDLSVLGGDKFVRGYFYGRFRDQNMTLLQAEYRTRLFWRIGLSAFGGANLLYSANAFNADSFKPNAGVGLRFLVDKTEGTNLRFDYAIGKDGQNGFYVSFGESF